MNVVQKMLLQAYIVGLLLFLKTAVAQNLTSYPTGNVFCNGSEVIFTCETRGSNTLTWSGDDDYVGSGTAFVASLHAINTTRNDLPNPNTIATLTQNYMDGDVRVLVSTLRIIPLSDEPSGNILCARAGGINESIDFQVVTLPMVPQDVASFHFNAYMFCFAISILRSPTNPAEAGATNYSPSVDGTSVPYGLMSSDFNFSDGMRYFILVYQSNCSVHSISISANNMCGESPGTDEIIQSIMLNWTFFGGASNIECSVTAVIVGVVMVAFTYLLDLH